MFAFSNSPAALGAVAAFFSVVALAADRPDPCVSDPKTHADYGLNAEGAWCTWDDIRTWKAAVSIDPLVNSALLICALLLGGGLQTGFGMLQEHVSIHQRP
jgi:hypothetical protein